MSLPPVSQWSCIEAKILISWHTAKRRHTHYGMMWLTLAALLRYFSSALKSESWSVCSDGAKKCVSLCAFCLWLCIALLSEGLRSGRPSFPFMVVVFFSPSALNIHEASTQHPKHTDTPLIIELTGTFYPCVCLCECTPTLLWPTYLCSCAFSTESIRFTSPAALAVCWG